MQGAALIEYLNRINHGQCLDIEEKKNKLIDERVKKMIKSIFKLEALNIQNLPYDQQIKILKYLKSQGGISLR